MKKATTDVYELDPVRDPRWARFVARHPQASVFHSPKWLGALQSAYGYQPVAVSTDDSESELTNGLVYCAVSSWLTGGRLVSLPFSDHCEPLVESASDLEKILLFLERQVDEGKWKHIELRPMSLAPNGNTRLGKSRPIVSTASISVRASNNCLGTVIKTIFRENFAGPGAKD